MLLAVDLGVFHRKAHAVSFREAPAGASCGSSLALAFNFGFYLYMRCHFPQDPRLMAMPGFDPAAAAHADRPRVPGRLRGRVLAVRRQHLRVRGGARLLRRSRASSSTACCSSASWAPWSSAAIFIALGARAAAVRVGGLDLRRLPASITGVRMMFGEDDGRSSPSERWVIRLFRKRRAGDRRLPRPALLRAAATGGSTPRRSSSRCCSWR